MTSKYSQLGAVIRTFVSQMSTMTLTTKPFFPPFLACLFFPLPHMYSFFFLRYTSTSLCLPFIFSFCLSPSLTAVVCMGLPLQLDNPPLLSLSLFFSSCSPVVIKTIRPYNDSAGVWVWSPISVQLIDLLANYPPFRSKSQRLFLSPFDKCWITE